MGVFVILIVTGAAFAVALTWTRQSLQLAWRSWLTEHLLGRWLDRQMYYKLALSDEAVTSPEARLSEDVRLATEPLVDFATGFVSSALTAVTFAGILFVVGGSISVGGVTIPGYIAIAAVIYAVGVSSMTLFIGRPLAAAVDAKNEAEAQFRFGLTRIRENIESIALIRGDDDELRRAKDRFSDVAGRLRQMIRHQANLTWILNANTFFAGTFAILLAVPKYLASEITLGEMMQIGAAFTSVLAALNWFAENFIAVAAWRASAKRVAELHAAFEELEQLVEDTGAAGLTVSEHDVETLVLKDVTLLHRDGETVVEEASVSIEPGERILLAGESGTGKSTLIRSIAGLWPWGTGSVLLPKGAKVAFVPQRPYIPSGTLRDALAYPDPGQSLDTDKAIKALEETGLGYKIDELDSEAELDQSLSGGERQRIAFARLILQSPNVIVMDEATAALDVDSENRLLRQLMERFPKAIVLSVGHRPGLESVHTRKIVLVRTPSGARFKPRLGDLPAPTLRKVRRLRQRIRDLIEPIHTAARARLRKS